MEKPFVGRDVLAINGARKLIELFVIDIGEDRNFAERGSRVSRAPFAFSAHEMTGTRRQPITARAGPIRTPARKRVC